VAVAIPALPATVTATGSGNGNADVALHRRSVRGGSVCARRHIATARVAVHVHRLERLGLRKQVGEKKGLVRGHLVAVLVLQLQLRWLLLWLLLSSSELRTVGKDVDNDAFEG
jgi:hypothetical protein